MDIVYWDDPDVEQLKYSDKDEAIEELLDSMDLPFPETMEIAGFERREIGNYLNDTLDDVLENLDMEFGGEDDYSKATDKMRVAEEAFIKVIKEEYEVFQCKEVCRETINVNEWIKLHRPDWLDEWKF